MGRSVTGWGYAGHGLSDEEIEWLAGMLTAQFPDFSFERQQPVSPHDVTVAAPRLTVPEPLTDVCAVDAATRIGHAIGRSYVDVVGAFHGDFGPMPDVVACPRDAGDVAAVLEWCAQTGTACVPYGGGTSVVGGVNPPAGDRPVVTLQTRAMDRVVDVDHESRAARIQAGIEGPALEEQLRPTGLSLQFFPQSFEMSTLGGWIATRASGHYATRLTHIDDLVESVTAVTPSGLWSSRRLPGSAAGPSPDRWLLGSEGVLGVITEAWVRVQERPRYRASASVRFPSFTEGAAAVRALAQSGLDPANCRLLDPTEAMLNGAGDGSEAVLVLGFESGTLPVQPAASAALDLCRDLGGACPEGLRVRLDERQDEDVGADDPATAWRRAFVRAPYLRDGLVALGVISETFETAVTWDRFSSLVADVMSAVEHAVADICGDGLVTCRITHAYPDGAAPYFTVIAPGRRGAEVVQWREIKAAASEAVLAAGGTITHHHAVGRDHRPWYDRQRPEPFAVALEAAKAALDPAEILNPGVLIGS